MQQQTETNKGGRPQIFDETAKVLGIKMDEKEHEELQLLCDKLKCKSKSAIARLLISLGHECMADDDFINYCMLYKLSPAQLFDWIFTTWRENLQRYAPPLDKDKHRFEDILKMFE